MSKGRHNALKKTIADMREVLPLLERDERVVCAHALLFLEHLAGARREIMGVIGDKDLDGKLKVKAVAEIAAKLGELEEVKEEK